MDNRYREKSLFWYLEGLARCFNYMGHGFHSKFWTNPGEMRTLRNSSSQFAQDSLAAHLLADETWCSALWDTNIQGFFSQYKKQTTIDWASGRPAARDHENILEDAEISKLSYPLVNIQKTMENCAFVDGLPVKKIEIFYGYVKLPEGIIYSE